MTKRLAQARVLKIPRAGQLRALGGVETNGQRLAGGQHPNFTVQTWARRRGRRQLPGGGEQWGDRAAAPSPGAPLGKVYKQRSVYKQHWVT